MKMQLRRQQVPRHLKLGWDGSVLGTAGFGYWPEAAGPHPRVSEQTP